MRLPIYIPDATYDKSDSPSDSEQFRKGLVAEYGLEFKGTNIGAGVDLPAYVTFLVVDHWPFAAAFALFFSGKKVEKNLDAWQRLAKRIGKFFHHNPILDRQGAADLAVEKVMEELGGLPRSIQLVGYRLNPYGLDNDADSVEQKPEIAPAAPALHLGFADHVFDIIAEGGAFRVTVRGHSVEITEPG